MVELTREQALDLEAKLCRNRVLFYMFVRVGKEVYRGTSVVPCTDLYNDLVKGLDKTSVVVVEYGKHELLIPTTSREVAKTLIQSIRGEYE